MSWGIQQRGTKAEVAKLVSDDFDRIQEMYPSGTGEGDEVATVRAAVNAAIARLDDVENTYYGDQVQVNASGSNSWSREKERPTDCSFSMRVVRLPKEPAK